jgi:hypothetical protein
MSGSKTNVGKSSENTMLAPDPTVRASVRIKFPSSLDTSSSKKLMEFVPPRSANACIGTKKSGKYFLITSSCSQPVLAVTKGDRANGGTYDGYFLTDHYFNDPIFSDQETRHDGEVETTSCFWGDKYCTMEWLETLQHCKVWAPAQKISSYGYRSTTRSYPLDCAPDMSTRTPNSLWDEFNKDLYTSWDKYLDANLAGKRSQKDEGATQCAVQMFVPLLQIHLDTMYRHQQQRGFPHSTCDATVFGTHK